MKLENLNQYIINLLVRVICWRMSNLVVFNMAYFCFGGGEVADEQFRQAINQELFRRGLLKTPFLSTDNFIADKFTVEEIETVDYWFHSDPGERTAEDYYILLVTGRDRWAERNTPKRKRRAARRAAEGRTKP